MSKEIGFYARNYGKTRDEMRALVTRLLPESQFKITKGLLWISNEGMPTIEAALNHPEEPRSIEPEIIEALILPGARNPRFEYARLRTEEKVGVLIPSRAKGRHVGKRVRVEVITANDGVKSYRLLCHQLKSLV